MALVLDFLFLELILEALVRKPVLLNNHKCVIVWLVCRDDFDQVFEFVLGLVFNQVDYFQQPTFVIFELRWAPDSCTENERLRNELQVVVARAPNHISVTALSARVVID